MARKVTNECCSCATPAYPCLGNYCPLRKVEHFLCDKCSEETLLYHYEGKELCRDCLLDTIEVVEGSEE